MQTKGVRPGAGQLKGRSVWYVLACLVCWGMCLSPEVFGGAMYSYVNEEGAIVITDDLKKVPERYRKRVKVTEVKEEAGKKETSLVPEALSRAWENVGKFKLPLPDTILSGLTNYQSVVLIVGFVVGALVFAIMTLSRSPAIKFAMKWALMFVVVGMVYALYFSELGSVDSEDSQRTSGPTTRPATMLQRVKTKAKGVERIEQRKAEQLDRLAEP